VIITASSSPVHLSNFPLNPTSAVLTWKIVTGSRKVKAGKRRPTATQLH